MQSWQNSNKWSIAAAAKTQREIWINIYIIHPVILDSLVAYFSKIKPSLMNHSKRINKCNFSLKYWFITVQFIELRNESAIICVQQEQRSFGILQLTSDHRPLQSI